jgi:YidC/Oxa1 family membrane protein insertase
MEERRLLIAVALSLLVLTVYGYLFPPPKRTPPLSPSPVAPPTTVASPTEPLPPSPPLPVETTPVADARERRVEVETSEMTVAFSNRGARLVSWQLKRYHDGRGRPEEMVEAVRSGPRPLDLETGDAAVDERLRDALFQPSAESLAVSGPREASLQFAFADGDLAADKTFRFNQKGYLVSVSASVRRAGREMPKKVLWGPGLGNPSPAEREVQGFEPAHGVVLSGAGVERLPAQKLAGARAFASPRWIGVESRYFAALLVPPGPASGGELRALSLPPGEDGKTVLAAQAALDLGSTTAPALLYVGPKDYDQLKTLGHDLAHVVPLGDWIGPIVVPLLALLRFVHGHLGNYGWSIVALTVLINLVMAPFRHYSIANGVKMAKIAPEMKVIQERYRKLPLLDPKRQEMNEEMARLYARHGMSMSTQMTVGCLPLLLTMPFLIAFYRVLQVSIELKGAPFLWIADLSQKDPLFITPVLMGASMFLMQRLTPTAMDPAQQKVMMLMPVMLMVMFFAAPAGLNLYWLSSNLCSIVQQGVTMNLLRGGGEATARAKKSK